MNTAAARAVQAAHDLIEKVSALKAEDRTFECGFLFHPPGLQVASYSDPLDSCGVSKSLPYGPSKQNLDEKKAVRKAPRLWLSHQKCGTCLNMF